MVLFRMLRGLIKAFLKQPQYIKKHLLKVKEKIKAKFE